MVVPYNVTSSDEYRNVSRVGRGVPLGVRQREKLWVIFETTMSSLAAEGLLSWDLVCHQVATMLASDRGREHQFQHVVADEVQDFGYADLCLLHALATGGSDDLFLCADQAQRIYRSRSSLAASGIKVSGRTAQLRVNYRTTEQISRFASQVIADSIIDDEGREHPREIISLLSGLNPEIQRFHTVAEEVEGVAVWLRRLLSQGYFAGDIAVFGRIDAVLGERAQPALAACGLDSAPLRDAVAVAEGCAAVGTMHRAKGLEFKVVVIMGCERGLVPLSVAVADHADPADREAAVEQERNLLYVACTRAREMLLITSAGTLSEFLA